jgi:DnaJ-class molecular chaperone
MATCSMMTPPATELAAAPVEEARMVCPECDGTGKHYSYFGRSFDCDTCKGDGYVSPDEQLVGMAEAVEAEAVEDWTEFAGVAR